MGKHPLDAILSIGGDVLAPFTGGASALIGNSISAADEASRGDFLSAIMNVVSAGAAGAGSGLAAGLPGADVAAQTGQVAGAELASAAGLNPLATELASSTLGEAGKYGVEQAYGSALPAALQRTLGISQSGPAPTPQTSLAPKSPSTATGGGAGPGGAPGGLDIQGGTAPKIYPYTQAPTGGSIGAQSGAQMQQPRSI